MTSARRLSKTLHQGYNRFTSKHFLWYRYSCFHHHHRQENKDNRKGIFVIDAKDGFTKDGAKNRLREQDIKRIVDAWDAQHAIPHYCRLVEWSEIEKNDYNLNISRYIQPIDTEIQHNIEAHLHGGLPATDVENMETFWKACPTLKDKLFRDTNNGYYSLKPKKKKSTMS